MPKKKEKIDFTQKTTRAVGLMLAFFIIISLIIIFYIINNEDKLFYIFKDNVSQEGEYNEEEELETIGRQAIEKAYQESLEKVKPVSSSDHLWGEIDAPVQLIVYSEFDCLFCYDFHETIKQIKEEFGQDVVVAFRHYIMNNHPFSLQAALASECAAEQGEFWSMYDELYQLNKAKEMTIDKFYEIAQNLNLDLENFDQCFNMGKYKDKVLEQSSAGEQAGVIGTPTVFVNNIPLPGAYPFEDFIRSNSGEEIQGMKTIILKHLK